MSHLFGRSRTCGKTPFGCGLLGTCGSSQKHVPPVMRLEFQRNPTNMSPMTATVTAPMIRGEIGDDGNCVLTFDRPDSGTNIFDAPTMQNLSDHLDAIEKDPSLRGVIVT